MFPRGNKLFTYVLRLKSKFSRIIYNNLAYVFDIAKALNCKNDGTQKHRIFVTIGLEFLFISHI